MIFLIFSCFLSHIVLSLKLMIEKEISYTTGAGLVISGHESSFSFCDWWIPAPIYSMSCPWYAL